MRILTSLLAAALIAGATVAHASPAIDAQKAKAEAKLAKALKGRIAGKPVDCIMLRDIRSSQIIDRTAIVYDTGSTLYVNRPEGGASSLTFDPILLTDTHSSQLCSIDTVKLLDRSSHFSRGFVHLGEFVPYRRVKAE